MRKSGIIRDVAAGITGGAIFILFLFALKLNIFISILAGLGAFAGVVLLFGSTGNQDADESGSAFANAVEECYKKIKEIRAYKQRIKKPSVVASVEELCIAAESMLEEYKKNPVESKSSIGYYLDSTSRILKKYIELLDMRINTPEIENMIEKSENIIHSVNLAFRQNIENQLGNEIVDLDAEISVLEKTLKTEGL